MNVLFLGNGFDLRHKLPTKYINFLNTVDFLSTQYVSKISTVGDVFSDKKLISRDIEIKESYSLYGENYDEIVLDDPVLNQLKELSNNLWYKYFSKTLNYDVKWIDFEKEIYMVIRSFQNLFALNVETDVDLYELDIESKYIIEQFDFFLISTDVRCGYPKIKQEYLIEVPIGSKNKIMDKTAIVKELTMQLNEFSQALKTYLKFFVEKMVEKATNIPDQQWKQAFQYTDYAITFNYTNTYELLYKRGEVLHIHGNVNTEIVLGVNPDGADTIETVDTTFVPFKKYFQRIKHKTDIKYLEFIEKYKNSTDLALYIIGHSLNITDKDIIQEVFSVANKIFILSYDDQDESNHISNLINIFGKSDFDQIRREKDISFISISEDIKTAMKENSNEEKNRRWNAMMRAVR